MNLTPGPLAPWRQITDLSKGYGVALTTARKALDRLKADGLVVTSPMGTFVAPEDQRP